MTFNIRASLLLVGLCALVLASLITPLVRREQLVKRLESRTDIVGWMQFGDVSFFERLLGVSGKVESVWFIGTGSRSILSPDLFESTSEFSPLVQLEVENLDVQTVANYPQVTQGIVIRNIGGVQCSHWLDELCAKQSNLVEFEVSETTAFSDKQLVTLARIPTLDRITLDSVEVSGVGFRSFQEHRKGFELTLAKCPLSDEGLREVVKCRSLQSLALSFLPDCQIIPNLQILLEVSPSVDVYVEVRKECVDPKLNEILQELDEHFTNFIWIAL